MQDITDISPQVLNIRDIEWDKDCEFMYSPFAIVIHKDGKRYAQIEHGVEGFISDIQYFDAQGHMTKHYIMDDRGLVSSVIYYQNNHPSYQDYLNTEGIWQFREYLQEDGRVEINPIFAIVSTLSIIVIWGSWWLNFLKNESRRSKKVVIGLLSHLTLVIMILF